MRIEWKNEMSGIFVFTAMLVFAYRCKELSLFMQFAKTNKHYINKILSPVSFFPEFQGR